MTIAHSLPTHVEATSASDRTDNWPFWMLWDGHVNVTAPVLRALGHEPNGAVFLPRAQAELVARHWNSCAALGKSEAAAIDDADPWLQTR